MSFSGRAGSRLSITSCKDRADHHCHLGPLRAAGVTGCRYNGTNSLLVL